jgi:hypothetical protein
LVGSGEVRESETRQIGSIFSHPRHAVQLMCVGFGLFQEGGHVTSHLERILTRLLASHLESAFLRWASLTPVGAPWPASS